MEMGSNTSIPQHSWNPRMCQQRWHQTPEQHHLTGGLWHRQIKPKEWENAQEKAGHAAACILGGFLSGHTQVSLSCLGAELAPLQDELGLLQSLPASHSHQAEGAASNPSLLAASSPVHSSHIFEHLAAHHKGLWKKIPFPKRCCSQDSPGSGFWGSHTGTTQKKQSNRGLAQNRKGQRFLASKIKSLKTDEGKFKYSIKGKIFTSKRSVRQYLSRGMSSPEAGAQTRCDTWRRRDEGLQCWCEKWVCA